MRDNPQTILEKHCPVFGPLFLDKSNKAQMGMLNGILSAMEEHALQYKTLEQSIRDLWVQACLDRDELNEQYKIAVRDRNTVREMYKETLQERDGWISEVNELKAKVSELNVYLEDRHKYIEELENTLGLRNRSNPDLTIDDEQKSIFDRWKECKD